MENMTIKTNSSQEEDYQQLKAKSFWNSVDKQKRKKIK